MAVGALEPQFYALLLEGLGLSDTDLPDQNDRAGWPVLAARFETVFASQTRDHWAQVFAHTDACVAPVLTLDEATQDAHMRARGTYVDVNGVLQAAVAPRLSGTPATTPPPPTGPGAQTEVVLAELGYDSAAIAALRADGVLT